MKFEDVVDDITKDITAATKKVFETMVMMDIVQKQATLLDKTEISTDVICIITIAGDYHGVIGLFCTNNHSLKIASNMLKEEQKTLNGEVRDAMGEITNMIGGTAKRTLSDKYGEMSLSIPIVMTGNDMILPVTEKPAEKSNSIFCTTGDPWLMTAFTCDNEEFNVGLLLKNS